MQLKNNNFRSYFSFYKFNLLQFVEYFLDISKFLLFIFHDLIVRWVVHNVAVFGSDGDKQIQRIVEKFCSSFPFKFNLFIH
jgi:hypothetical protein